MLLLINEAFSRLTKKKKIKHSISQSLQRLLVEELQQELRKCEEASYEILSKFSYLYSIRSALIEKIRLSTKLNMNEEIL